MNLHLQSILLLSLIFCSITCTTETEQTKQEVKSPGLNFEQEKAAILETINGETKAAFNRDYEGWKDKWVHAPYVTKTYMNFADSSLSETLGWEEIDDFVRTYIEEHPEPDPLPTLVDRIEVRLYEQGAWVSYVQNDAQRGLKRETRLMEKVEGQWKIAGMQTVIYGPKKEE